jgi:hypothetical protein
MGFASYKCKGCKHPALCPDATNATNRWMSMVVAILPNGQVIKGEYDGYARIDLLPIHEKVKGEGQPLLYHRACWFKAGSPLLYDQKGSEWADDQGWFFEDGVHDMEAPV